MDSSLLEEGTDYAARAVRDTVTICSAVIEEGEEGIADFEHDDHADVHVLRDEDAERFFEISEEVESALPGFASGIRLAYMSRAPERTFCPPYR